MGAPPLFMAPTVMAPAMEEPSFAGQRSHALWLLLPPANAKKTPALTACVIAVCSPFLAVAVSAPWSHRMLMLATAPVRSEEPPAATDFPLTQSMALRTVDR